jgi:type II secretory pathway component PulK
MAAGWATGEFSRARWSTSCAAPPRHSGFAIVVALVCLVIISLILTSAARQLHDELQAVVPARRQLQSRWLAWSALERAEAQLQLDPGYTGEVWRIPAGEFCSDETRARAAQVEIRVSGARADEQRTIEVTADCPAQGFQRARMQMTRTVGLPQRVLQ